MEDQDIKGQIMELTINEIKRLLNSNLPTDLFDKLTQELNRLERNKEQDEITKRYVEIVIYEIKKKFPTLNITCEKENYYYLIVIDDHKIYYSTEFTKLCGYLDYTYLMPNEIFNVSFIIKYK